VFTVWETVLKAAIVSEWILMSFQFTSVLAADAPKDLCATFTSSTGGTFSFNPTGLGGREHARLLNRITLPQCWQAPGSASLLN
jgi:hypothetical protein